VKKGMAPGHTDGWGISGFKDGRAVYFARRPESAAQNEAEYRQAAERAAKSGTPLLLAHFRKASGSEPDIANTHPFHHQDWVFAHNGTIFGAAASFPLVSAAPQGATDSERFFLWLFEQIHTEADPTRALVELIKKSRSELVYTALNFLLSDGTRLWAYREFGEKRLEKGETVKDREDYYTLFYATQSSSVVFCSEPLAGVSPHWTSISQRTLAIVTPQAPVPQLMKI
jgi:glutamine amidotransferase